MIDYGSFIRTERERLGQSRQVFADGLCHVKTLARIENGEQVPSSEQFRLMMEKLGVAGFSYTDCSAASSIRLMELERGILKAMEGRRIDDLSDMLDEYKEISDESLPCKRFFGYASAYFLMLLDGDSDAFLLSCKELVDLNKAASSNQTYLQSELRVLNAAAMILAKADDPVEGIVLFNQLIISQRQGKDLLPSYWVNLAVLFNNAAVAEKQSFPKEAKAHMDKAMDASIRAGDMLLAIRIRRTKFLLFEEEARGRAKEVHALLLKRMFKAVNDVFGMYDSFWEFLIEPCYLLMP